MKWCKVVAVKSPKKLERVLNKAFGTKWTLHSWSAGTRDRILVIFERNRSKA